MLCLLHNFWQLMGSSDLTDILSGGEYWLEANIFVDIAF